MLETVYYMHAGRACFLTGAYLFWQSVVILEKDTPWIFFAVLWQKSLNFVKSESRDPASQKFGEKSSSSSREKRRKRTISQKEERLLGFQVKLQRNKQQND